MNIKKLFKKEKGNDESQLSYCSCTGGISSKNINEDLKNICFKYNLNIDELGILITKYKAILETCDDINWAIQKCNLSDATKSISKDTVTFENLNTELIFLCKKLGLNRDDLARALLEYKYRYTNFEANDKNVINEYIFKNNNKEVKVDSNEELINSPWYTGIAEVNPIEDEPILKDFVNYCNKGKEILINKQSSSLETRPANKNAYIGVAYINDINEVENNTKNNEGEKEMNEEKNTISIDNNGQEDGNLTKFKGLESKEVYTKLIDKHYSPMVIRKITHFGFSIYVTLITDDDLTDLDKNIMNFLNANKDEYWVNNIQKVRDLAGALTDFLVKTYEKTEGAAVLMTIDKAMIESLYGDLMTHASCKAEMLSLLNMMPHI